ncbi:MAG TPA: DUF4350 domain-containing protein, partial [Microbacterium sp.]|uniref:DUF4350 domain-containing protein n=1 Tax=Microbacterium sp. TaxID=51671 RepID=UPI002B4A6B1A
AGWAVIAVVLVVIVGIGALITPRSSTSQGTLDPRSTRADGARALVRILQQRGVTVDIVTDAAGAHAALAQTPATLWLPDSPALTVADLLSLSKDAAATVVGDPGARSARVLFGATVAGYGGGTLTPGCSVPAAQRAGHIAPGGLFHATDGGTASCYRDGDAAGLLVRQDGARQLSLVDGTQLFTNARLAENGNAALAVNLLGARQTVVWLMPEAGRNASAAATLADLTPGWVTPLILLGFATALAAALWRGRRFGPLVTERLPVTVRAAETAEGRARLYARASDPAHAYAQLRAGALRRLARLLGLGSAATAAEIADAAASVTGRSPAQVRALLTAAPADDRALVDLATHLYALENAVHAAIFPEGTARDH